MAPKPPRRQKIPGDVFAGKSFVEVGGALGVCSGNVAVALPAAGHDHWIQAEAFDRFDGGFQVDGRTGDDGAVRATVSPGCSGRG